MRPAAFALLLWIGVSQAHYLGKEIGPLSELHHGVRGSVFAVDSRTLYLHDFHYDGEGPAAYFYVGTSKSPTATGSLRLRDERGGTTPLRRYRGEGVTLSLPDGKTLRDVTWFSVWCDEYSVNFGSVDIPRSLEYPKPAKVAALHGVHGVSSDAIVVVDAQTLLIPNFSYDGEAPDAKFWVGRGDKPSPQGIRIPDENGKESPLRKYDKKTIVLTLPGELTVFDIGHFAVWCEAFTVNFGHVLLPRAMLVNVPPSLKMLGVSPQSRNKALSGETTHAPPRSRKPLARLDATTYRPSHLRAGPPATLEQPATHAHHRRADQITPSQHQLIPTDTQSKDKDFEIQRSEEIEQTSFEPQYQDSLLNYQQKERLPQQGVAEQRAVDHSNQRQHYQIQNSQYQQMLQNQIYHTAQYQRQPLDRTTEDLLYQQQLYEQQRRALERELQQYRQIQYQHEPVQYNLLPYNPEQSQGGGRSYRRVDLDLVAGSRSQ
ncbi:protein Skeletor, isoforms B/C isoform X3 [Nymphalis io]|uniref:protein Skeletor, isoforms B/C isoform X3 n=1 Tax=Inachis io TaxID=171585 RepID=UPI002169AC5E|nr:protein Skeletor, isoforms B/C isoform X3 [Nymphalis io]